jgi:hypothetical protein
MRSDTDSVTAFARIGTRLATSKAFSALRIYVHFTDTILAKIQERELFYR